MLMIYAEDKINKVTRSTMMLAPVSLFTNM